MSKRAELAAAFPEEYADAIAFERARIREILSCDEAKGRTNLALHIALETNEIPATARDILAHAAPTSNQYDKVETES